VKIALAGNPNCGKSTLFNAMTGAREYVGNWSGVTVEKKGGKLRGHPDAEVVDLPGIYSLSPYTMEEVVSRNFLVNDGPDVIINIVDGTNLERNLYLTTQILELGTPTIVAVNMLDVLEKNGGKLDIRKLSDVLGCEVVSISALKNKGVAELVEKAVKLGKAGKEQPVRFSFSVEIEEVISLAVKKLTDVPPAQKRFIAIKALEKDTRLGELTPNVPDVSEEIGRLEEVLGDDSESIFSGARYEFISSIIDEVMIGREVGGQKLSLSDKIDRTVTNRWLAIPIMMLIMGLVYYLTVSMIGSIASDFTSDKLFGEGFHLFGMNGNLEEDREAWEAGLLMEEPDPSDYGVWIPGIPVLAERGLNRLHVKGWMKSLVLDGVIAGVGAVLGFIPQMLVLFLLLAVLEECGYMARIAFVMDRIFRLFGLSGKAFIPILMGTGCGVPGIMASRTIENERDRRVTVITTTFIPCSAKLPVISLIAASVFHNVWWVGWSAYFVGIAAIICSGIILKKTKALAGDPAPFVMELPAYHIPAVRSVLRSMWERGWGFIKKAGTVILLATIFVWAGSKFGWTDGSFGFSTSLMLEDSLLGKLGHAIRWLFVPLGFGSGSIGIKASVATIMGILAKEEIVGVFGVLDLEGFTRLTGYAFLLFNLLCAPCVAAIVAIRREMNSRKWTWFALSYQCLLAYVVALCTYQFGRLLTGGGFTVWTVFAFAAAAGFLYLLLRSGKKEQK